MSFLVSRLFIAFFLLGSSYLSATIGRLYIIREAESVNGGLTLKGAARANILGNKDTFSGFNGIMQCMASNHLGPTLDTITPFAKSRGISVRFPGNFSSFQILRSLHDEFGTTETLLLCVPANQVAEIGNSLIKDPFKTVVDYPPDRFDLIYIFQWDGFYTYCITTENLMLGDSPTLPPGSPGCP